MKYTLKDISHFDFFEKLQAYLDAIQDKLSFSGTMTTEEIGRYRKEVVAQVKSHIKDNIEPETDEFIDGLRDWYIRGVDNFYSEYADRDNREQEIEIKALHGFLKTLVQLRGYLWAIDTLLDPDKEPEIHTMEDKFQYVLEKLNSLYGNEYYSIRRILELNNIKQRDREANEIGINLKKKGHVILVSEYGETDGAKISVKGVAYIEKKLKQSKTKKTDTDLSKKLDNVLAELTTLGLGQEVLFNEIEELKTLQHKLSKKSWSQLLKGKLMDMATEKVLSKEIASHVYHYLVKSEFKLLDNIL